MCPGFKMLQKPSLTLARLELPLRIVTELNGNYGAKHNRCGLIASSIVCRAAMCLDFTRLMSLVSPSCLHRCSLCAHEHTETLKHPKTSSTCCNVEASFDFSHTVYVCLPNDLKKYQISPKTCIFEVKLSTDNLSTNELRFRTTAKSYAN